MIKINHQKIKLKNLEKELEEIHKSTDLRYSDIIRTSINASYELIQFLNKKEEEWSKE